MKSSQIQEMTLLADKSTPVFKDELETTMKLMGVTDLSQLHPGLLNTRDIDHLVTDSPLSIERARL